VALPWFLAKWNLAAKYTGANAKPICTQAAKLCCLNNQERVIETQQLAGEFKE